eukprot:5247275-Amphidinium_carterae.1
MAGVCESGKHHPSKLESTYRHAQHSRGMARVKLPSPLPNVTQGRRYQARRMAPHCFVADAL